MLPTLAYGGPFLRRRQRRRVAKDTPKSPDTAFSVSHSVWGMTRGAVGGLESRIGCYCESCVL